MPPERTRPYLDAEQRLEDLAVTQVHADPELHQAQRADRRKHLRDARAAAAARPRRAAPRDARRAVRRVADRVAKGRQVRPQAERAQVHLVPQPLHLAGRALDAAGVGR